MRPFWLAQALSGESDAAAPPVQGDQHADVCIVGGGFTGLWTAIQLRLHDPALDIAIIERDVCGAGASGRNGGCLNTWSTRFLPLMRLFGEAEAVRLVKVSEDAVGQITAFCRTSRIDAEVRVDGTLFAVTAPAQHGAMEPVLNALQARGIDSWHALPAAEVRRRAGSDRHLAGFFSPVAATVHPGKLVRGLRRVALAMGIRIYEHCPLLDFTFGDPVGVQTPAGRLRAGKLVLAMNAWMASRFAQFARTLAVVSSDMVITEPCADLLGRIGLADGVSVMDSRTFVHYYRTTEDGRLMLGKGGNTFAWRGRMLPVFDQPSPYAQMLTARLREFFPALASVPIAASWNGASDRSVTGLPFFGRFDRQPNVFYGFGYSGNGVGPSYLGGRILCSLVLGADDAWSRSPLTAGPLGRFPIEPFRYLGSLMVRNAIRRKERAEDEGRAVRWIDRRLSTLADTAGKADKA
jgi:putative aminophosphonate oxidoreductase